MSRYITATHLYTDIFTNPITHLTTIMVDFSFLKPNWRMNNPSIPSASSSVFLIILSYTLLRYIGAWISGGSPCFWISTSFNVFQLVGNSCCFNRKFHIPRISSGFSFGFSSTTFHINSVGMLPSPGTA